jgi:hypothetical protein
VPSSLGTREGPALTLMRAPCRSVRPSKGGPALIAVGLLALSCAPETGAPLDTTASAVTSADAAAPGALDLLFVIDSSSGMAPMQAKLAQQMPLFMHTIEGLWPASPDLHVAVISSDLGAPGDSTAALGCTTLGDQGQFQVGARGACADSTLAPGAGFVSNVGGVANYATADIATVVQCILPLGDGGCLFESPLAAVARALGADGAPPPSQNAGFLRPDAALAIIVLGDEDDCSEDSPATGLYSYNNTSGLTGLANALGPLRPYRCNEFGHLCVDPRAAGSSLIQPPEMPPPDAQGTAAAPTFDLARCQSNDTDGLLTPVGTLVNGIRALKADPDRQIVVGAIVPPVAPYTVAWSPQITSSGSSELWPQMEPSCGPLGTANPEATQTSADGSFGYPAVRITQWVQAFGSHGAVESICDANDATLIGQIGSMLTQNAPSTGGTGSGGATGGEATGGATGGGATGGGATGGDASGGGVPSLDGGAAAGASGTALVGGGGPGAQGGSAGRRTGLTAGGCNLGGSEASAGTLGLILGLLALAWGRRAARNVT